MKRAAGRLLSTGVAALLVLSRPARAQDAARNTAILRRSVPAPRGALEAQVGVGYNQGVGTLGDGPNAHVQDVAGVGAAAELALGYRFSPRLLVGAYGGMGLYTQIVPDTNVRSLSGGIQANWHFRPYRSLDPWLGLSVGYRTFSESPPNEATTTRHGFVLPRFAVGVDYRLNPSVAVGPLIAIDLSFFSRPGPIAEGGAAVSSFVFAGVAGRFDLFGEPTHPAVDLARR